MICSALMVGEADCCNTGHEASCRVVYHYHATTYCPYHMACQGPALGQCNRTQYGQPHLRPQGVTERGIGNANFCGKGCGADVCVQPGTPEPALRHYLDCASSAKTKMVHMEVNPVAHPAACH